jgi:PA14 domain-containing protein
MTSSRLVRGIAIGVVLAGAVSALPSFIDRFVARPGLVRLFYTQTAFRGTPVESIASEINLQFLENQTELPRQQFSARWRGFFFVPEAQTVELFAGGNDEVELRVDGQLLVRRNLTEGMRTIGRRVALEAGAHELSVDFQQFGGSMALNIQRTLAGQQPSPFLETELFTSRVDASDVRAADLARVLRRIRPFLWLSLALLVTSSIAARKFKRWRHTAAPQSVRDYAGRVWLVAVPALLGPAVVFVFGPHTIFANNTGEFAVPFSQLASPWLLKTAAINWILLFGLGCVVAVLSRYLAEVYAAILFAVGLVLWGQGNLWNADYGVMAGQELDLAQHSGRAPYEIAAFLIIVLLAVIFCRPISRIAPFASLVFIAVQGVAVAASSAGRAAQAPRWIEPPPEIYQFSATQNIIHIVLDEFQSDVFADILKQDRPTLDKQFSGFVYFSDHAAAFPTTSMSLPAMLTGLEYRNDMPAPEFVRQVFKKSSIFEKASRAGYEIDATSIVPVESIEEWLGPETSPNWSGARFRIRKPFISQGDYRRVAARQLLELSLFRHVPHSAKAYGARHPEAFYRLLWMKREGSPAEIRQHEASNSVGFLEHFTSLMTVGRQRPVYKLIHVGVPHRPIVVDRECRFIGLTDMSRETYTEQSRCAVKLVADVLDRARALGIYESSLIVVSSDHGTDLDPLGFRGESDGLSLIPGPSTTRLPAIVGTAKAIMFIKPPQRTGPISISDTPTTHIDLQPTLLDILGLPGGSPDASMLRRDPAQPRSREYGMYDPRQRFPKTYLDRLDVLTIDGRVADPNAWHFQRSIWDPAVKLVSRDVDVGPRSAHRYLGPGWSFEERERVDQVSEITFARALTRRVVVYASLPAGSVEVLLRVSSSPGPAPEAVVAEVDGGHTQKLASPGATGYRDVSVTIPAEASRPTVSQIVLDLQGTGGVPVFKLDRIVIRPR